MELVGSQADRLELVRDGGFLHTEFLGNDVVGNAASNHRRHLDETSASPRQVDDVGQLTEGVELFAWGDTLAPVAARFHWLDPGDLDHLVVQRLGANIRRRLHLTNNKRLRWVVVLVSLFGGYLLHDGD